MRWPPGHKIQRHYFHLHIIASFRGRYAAFSSLFLMLLRQQCQPCFRAAACRAARFGEFIVVDTRAALLADFALFTSGFDDEFIYISRCRVTSHWLYGHAAISFSRHFAALGRDYTSMIVASADGRRMPRTISELAPPF